MSRINNWQELSETERQTTLRLLAKRNAERISALKASGGAGQGQDAGQGAKLDEEQRGEVEEAVRGGVGASRKEGQALSD